MHLKNFPGTQWKHRTEKKGMSPGSWQHPHSFFCPIPPHFKADPAGPPFRVSQKCSDVGFKHTRWRHKQSTVCWGFLAVCVCVCVCVRRWEYAVERLAHSYTSGPFGSWSTTDVHPFNLFHLLVWRVLPPFLFVVFMHSGWGCFSTQARILA